MRLISHITGSGSLAGAVAFSQSGALALRARTLHTQPGRQAQRAVQNTFGAIPGAWRSLTHHQRTAWRELALELASSNPASRHSARTGYTLFSACNLRLAAIDAPAITAAPAGLPVIPPMDLFTAAPVYSQPEEPRLLQGWQLIVGYTVPPGTWVIIRATASRSATARSTDRTYFRQIAAFSPWPTYGLLVNEQWQSVYGTTPDTGAVTFEAQVVDATTGFAGPPVTCSTTWQAQQPAPAVPGTITIEMEGTGEATLTHTVFESEGNPIAGR